MTPQEVGARLVALLSAGTAGADTTDAPPAPAQGATDAAPAPAQGATDAPPAPAQGATDAPPAPAQGATDAQPAPTPGSPGAGASPGVAGPPRGAVAGVSGGEAYARATVDVPVADWPAAARAARDDPELACDYFDWLSAVDELEEGFSVVAHLWSTRHRHGLLLRTRVPRATPAVPSIVDLYPGAAWHERETYEMFGVDFPGHPGGLAPLLLPPEFEGHPLRKEFVLASRVAKAWPGAKEPGESDHAPAGGRRAPMRPPGVPAPNEWGPQAGTLVDHAEAAPPKPARTRPTRAPQLHDRRGEGNDRRGEGNDRRDEGKGD